jgi:hypothetical protein
LSTEERAAVIKGSVIFGHYENAIDRESAYEKLTSRTVAKPGGQPQAVNPAEPSTGRGNASAGDSSESSGGGLLGALGGVLMGSTGPRGGRHAGLVETLAKSAVRTVGSQIGREIVRGVLGGILGGGKRR